MQNMSLLHSIYYSLSAIHCKDSYKNNDNQRKVEKEIGASIGASFWISYWTCCCWPLSLCFIAIGCIWACSLAGLKPKWIGYHKFKRLCQDSRKDLGALVPITERGCKFAKSGPSVQWGDQICISRRRRKTSRLFNSSLLFVCWTKHLALT